jgi:hypothetical protein
MNGASEHHIQLDEPLLVVATVQRVGATPRT